MRFILLYQVHPIRVHTPINNTNTLLFIYVKLRLSLSNEELETGLYYSYRKLFPKLYLILEYNKLRQNNTFKLQLKQTVIVWLSGASKNETKQNKPKKEKKRKQKQNKTEQKRRKKKREIQKIIFFVSSALQRSV